MTLLKQLLAHPCALMAGGQRRLAGGAQHHPKGLCQAAAGTSTADATQNWQVNALE